MAKTGPPPHRQGAPLPLTYKRTAVGLEPTSPNYLSYTATSMRFWHPLIRLARLGGGVKW